jgi:hypothetical protein
MEKRPIICSFYTDSYKDYADKLRTSAESFGFETEIVPIENKGSWIKTIYYRADFIRKMLEKHRQDVVWIDCDAEMKRAPALFENFEGDIGVHYATMTWFNNQIELLGGTLYFAYTPKTLELVYLWIKLNKEYPDEKRSQIVLQKAIKLWDGKIIPLPASYVYISDLMEKIGEPVIQHYQASRKFKEAPR